MQMTGMRIQPQVRKYLYGKAARKGIPISGTFELTPLCNMNCRMCYVRMTPEEMAERGSLISAEEWIRFGRICAEQGMVFLLLTGGEPFLRKDFRYIYTELKKLGLIISINSNGTLIDRETVEWLKMNPPHKINITLYGGSNETYHRLCMHPTGYDAATRAIDLLKEAGIYVSINGSFTKQNIEDMEAIYAFAKSREIAVRSATYMFPPVRNAREGMTDEAVRFTPKEAGRARFLSELYDLSEERMNYRLKALHAGQKDLTDLDEECERTADEKMGCMAGRGSFWITWDGRMTPCGMMNQPVTRPFEIGFGAAWESIRQATDEIRLPAACKECRKRFACMICGALSIAEGDGDAMKRPEYLCQMTDAYLAEMGAEYRRRFEE